jgi:cell pole-organizing protein PopZ
MTVSRSAPLLKAWLDENLPVIVEGLVSAQMEKHYAGTIQ